MIEIISPKKVTLEGKTSRLYESDITNSKLDLIQEQNIVYPDLVFTLSHNPHKYLRPFVRREGHLLKVVGNSLFFKALKEVGIETIRFDMLLGKDTPLEQIMEEYNLEFPIFQGAKDYCQRFLFFKALPSSAYTDNPDILVDPRNDNTEFKKNNCIAYKAFVYPSSESCDVSERNRSIHHEFIARLVNENGYLRSIDGIRDRSGILGRYIS